MAKAPTKSSVSTFSIPADDADRIDRVRLRLAQAGHLVNRSEVVRLALIALEGSEVAVAAALVDQLDRRRPGRPPAKKRVGRDDKLTP